MSSTPDVADLQGDLLDAALAPEDWRSVLRKITNRFDASTCDLYLMRGDEMSFSAGAWHDVSIPEYLERFIDREPRTLELRGLKTGEVTTDLKFVSRQTLKSHDYYAEFLPRYGLSGCIAGTVLNTPARRAYIGIHYPRGRWEFDDATLAMASRLQPMLARAVNLQFRVAGLDAVDALRHEALDRFPQGMLALDAHSRILLSNTSAKMAIADRSAFRIRNGRLQCVESAVQTRFDVFFQNALARRGSQGGVLLAGRGPIRYSLMVTPARTESRDESATFVLVFIAPIGVDHAGESVAQLQALFSLTAAEARVASHLVHGRSLKGIAALNQMTYESVRFLVKQIFAKLDVHTQVELVAILSEALHRFPLAESESALRDGKA
jgi:DNA-binding CsgD family transcriptional regulator